VESHRATHCRTKDCGAKEYGLGMRVDPGLRERIGHEIRITLLTMHIYLLAVRGYNQVENSRVDQ
jgi:hypothetical protein